ncbi:MAG TPA: hypothetical protein VKB88_05070, partial [Bryobacteraceae bacterium]|nr:hypothetical protein [Bryobacteraceae bacterium]
MRRLPRRRCFQREDRPRGGNCCPKGKIVLAWHTNIAARWLDLQQWCFARNWWLEFLGSQYGRCILSNQREGGMKAMKSSRFWTAAPLLLAVYA